MCEILDSKRVIVIVETSVCSLNIPTELHSLHFILLEKGGNNQTTNKQTNGSQLIIPTNAA